MKTRTGFISNSSSSSFIVGLKNGQTKITISIEVDLKKYSTKTIKTKEELDEYFIDQYGYKTIRALLLDDKYLCELYDKIVESIQKRETILIGNFESDGDPLESFLCDNGIPETNALTIIQNEVGY